MPLTHTDLETVLAQLTAEAAALVARKDLLDAAIVGVRHLLDPIETPAPTLAAAVARKQRVTPPRKAPRADTDDPPAPTSKTGMYRDAILQTLTRAEHHCGDGSFIRHAVAKACGVNEKKDAAFGGDVGNALQVLKRDGTVRREGALWILTEQGS